MSGARTFFRCIGEAILGQDVRGLGRLLPGSAYLYDVAGDAMRRLRALMPEAELRGAIEAVARCPVPEVRHHVGEVLDAIAAEQPANIRRALALFLFQLPPTIRQVLKRPQDPTGTNFPAGVSLKRGEDLLPLLPMRLPLFQPGECSPGDDRWVLRDLLGVGGFGEVWKAQHRDYPTMFAAFKFCTDPAARQRLLAHEGKVVSQVMSQGRVAGIVPLLDADIHADPPWLRYEYIEGGDLAGVLLAWMHAPGRNRIDLASRITLRLAKIVGHFHRAAPPVIHRDLKPQNILVQKLGGQKFELRIADFGIGDIASSHETSQAIVQTLANMSLPTQLRGAYTPLYASPQQKRSEPPDVRDDVYALGMIWYQMLVQDLGREAPSGLDWADDLQALGVSEPLVKLLAECLSSKAEKRPADAAVLAERMQRLLRHGAEVELIDEEEGPPAGTARYAEPMVVAELYTPQARRPRRPSGETPRPAKKSSPAIQPIPTRPERVPPDVRRRERFGSGSKRTAKAQQSGLGFRLAGCAALLCVVCLLGIPVAIFHREVMSFSNTLVERFARKDGQETKHRDDKKDLDSADKKAPDELKPVEEKKPSDDIKPPDEKKPDVKIPDEKKPPVELKKLPEEKKPPVELKKPEEKKPEEKKPEEKKPVEKKPPIVPVAKSSPLDGSWTARLKQDGLDEGTFSVVFEGDQLRLSAQAVKSPLIARYRFDNVMVRKISRTDGIKFNYQGVLMVKGATTNAVVDMEVRNNQMILHCPASDPDIPESCRGVVIEFTRP